MVYLHKSKSFSYRSHIEESISDCESSSKGRRCHEHREYGNKCSVIM